MIMGVLFIHSTFNSEIKPYDEWNESIRLGTFKTCVLYIHIGYFQAMCNSKYIKYICEVRI